MSTSERKTQKAAEKWGDAAEAGFQTLPDILLKKQVELGLSATDMLVLMNITMHWWYQEQRPFPRTKTIADRMGCDSRTVQRSLRKMTDLGLITRMSETDERGDIRYVVDLENLVAKLSKFARTDEAFLARQRRKEAA
ncbi:helix-turn-helix domain-containing protein [Jannaschia aquimarina]|uniref:MarR family protein n=1 Tax=Jannaschia aquimarina TaxID=935700 RepID=A0A0D1EAJ3_9RHOB|nr:helix-turn-helix domain-containing protein [Jannaschia aquimarina]KIT14719.1 MarR family protein [Jannaschia aquimarina]SNT44167.1 Helix-turn-helix domain-containing protein [Jannaschia aquimarina]